MSRQRTNRRLGGRPLAIVGLLVLSVPLAVPSAAQLNNGRMTRPEVGLPDGPARQVILRSCTECHGIDDYAYNSLDRAGWHSLVDAMVEKGAVIADGDRTILLDWLLTEFGPDSTPFPREYVVVPVESELFANDAAANDYLGVTCGACHSLDRVETAQFNEARWKTVITDMRRRGATVAEENVDDLVAFLTRTRGAD